jgi:hypothetical protein
MVWTSRVVPPAAAPLPAAAGVLLVVAVLLLELAHADTVSAITLGLFPGSSLNALEIR